MDYEKLLKKAKKELPEEVSKSDRFDIPKVRGHIQGNKTVISNFSAIVSIIGREQEHILKYILKTLATPGEFKGNLLLLGRKIPASNINEKINQYVKEFVLCKECGKGDTKITKEGRFTFIKCTACGAKHSIKSKI
jgi:translation initiation factor 2 subunit 2|tara:strand:+ start:123 stop:530 length:408 start_codon:yes stop_codon:yes gene_type:complete